MIINDFKLYVTPCISEDLKPYALLAVLDIIKKDEYIKKENRNNFKKFVKIDIDALYSITIFDFSDFMGRVLHYVVCGDVPNTTGASYLNTITLEYIQQTANPYKNEIKWDASKDEVFLLYGEIYKIFLKGIECYQINYFVEQDPARLISFNLIEQCEAFIDFMKTDIFIPYFSDFTEKLGKTMKNIQKFTQILNDYTDYLVYNMRPVDGAASDIMCPIAPRDSLQEMEFEKETIEYRKKLIAIAKELFEHIVRPQEM